MFLINSVMSQLFNSHRRSFDISSTFSHMHERFCSSGSCERWQMSAVWEPNEKKQFGARFLRLSGNCHDNNHLHAGPIIERFHPSREGLSHFPLSNYKKHSAPVKASGWRAFLLISLFIISATLKHFGGRAANQTNNQPQTKANKNKVIKRVASNRERNPAVFTVKMSSAVNVSQFMTEGQSWC